MCLMAVMCQQEHINVQIAGANTLINRKLLFHRAPTIQVSLILKSVGRSCQDKAMRQKIPIQTNSLNKAKYDDSLYVPHCKAVRVGGVISVSTKILLLAGQRRPEIGRRLSSSHFYLFCHFQRVIYLYP